MTTSDKHNGVRLVRVDADHRGQRLDNFLAGQLKGVPRAAVYKMIRTGQVRINGGRAKPASRLEQGDEVRIPPARTRESHAAPVSASVRQRLRETILYEDRDLLVIN